MKIYAAHGADACIGVKSMPDQIYCEFLSTYMNKSVLLYLKRLANECSNDSFAVNKLDPSLLNL